MTLGRSYSVISALELHLTNHFLRIPPVEALWRDLKSVSILKGHFLRHRRGSGLPELDDD